MPKEGPGSLKSMFAKAAVKHPADDRSADSPKKPRLADEEAITPEQQPQNDQAPIATPVTTPTKAKIASSPAKGTLLAFFAKKD